MTRSLREHAASVTSELLVVRDEGGGWSLYAGGLLVWRAQESGDVSRAEIASGLCSALSRSVVEIVCRVDGFERRQR